MRNLVLTALSALALGQIASADTRIVVRRDTVLPIVFEDTLDFRHSLKGDRFYARVEDNVDLPHGTKLVGHIVAIHESRRRAPAYMDLEFDEIIMPDGDHERISGVPIQPNSRNSRRDGDGRIVVIRDRTDRDNTVAAASIGGLIIGSLGKRPIEGFILGNLAGHLAADSAERERRDVVVKSGDRMGALIDRTLDFDWAGRFERRREHIIDLRIDGRTLDFGRDERPFRDGDVVMIPLRATARQLHIEVEEGRNQQLFITGRDLVYRVEVGSRDARSNGEHVKLARPVVTRDGTVFVPAEVFRDITHGDLRIVEN